jgi:hypothetical protein
VAAIAEAKEKEIAAKTAAVPALGARRGPMLLLISARQITLQSTKAMCNRYRLYIYEFSDHIEFEFYGNYYDPDYGYVLVTTTENFHIYGDDKWPSSGSLLIQGKDTVTAELITVDTANCVIKADLDGDGVLDFESEILNWESLGENFGLAPVTDYQPRDR